MVFIFPRMHSSCFHYHGQNHHMSHWNRMSPFRTMDSVLTRLSHHSFDVFGQFNSKEQHKTSCPCNLVSSLSSFDFMAFLWVSFLPLSLICPASIFFFFSFLRSHTSFSTSLDHCHLNFMSPLWLVNLSSKIITKMCSEE